MLIISYVVKRTDLYGRSTVVELCGEFRDWQHFDRFTELERFRGWNVVSHKLEKERN